MSDLWLAVGEDAQAERFTRYLAMARQATRSSVAFALGAVTPEEFGSRTALVAERIDADILDVLGNDTSEFLGVRQALVAEIESDFDKLHQARLDERIESERRALARQAQEREAAARLRATKKRAGRYQVWDDASPSDGWEQGTVVFESDDLEAARQELISLQDLWGADGFRLVDTAREATKKREWPRVPSTNFPGELTPSCPKCGSTSVILTGNNLGSDVVRGNFYTIVRCGACGYQEVTPSKSLRASRRTAAAPKFSPAKMEELRKADDAKGEKRRAEDAEGDAKTKRTLNPTLKPPPGARKPKAEGDGKKRDESGKFATRKHAATYKSVDDLLRAWPPQPGVSEASADGFYDEGYGGDEFADALKDSGWTSVWMNSSSSWCLADPNGKRVTYIEGDLYRGDKGRRKSSTRKQARPIDEEDARLEYQMDAAIPANWDDLSDEEQRDYLDEYGWPDGMDRVLPAYRSSWVPRTAANWQSVGREYWLETSPGLSESVLTWEAIEGYYELMVAMNATFGSYIWMVMDNQGSVLAEGTALTLASAQTAAEVAIPTRPAEVPGQMALFSAMMWQETQVKVGNRTVPTWTARVGSRELTVVANQGKFTWAVFAGEDNRPVRRGTANTFGQAQVLALRATAAEQSAEDAPSFTSDDSGGDAPAWDSSTDDTTEGDNDTDESGDDTESTEDEGGSDEEEDD